MNKRFSGLLSELEAAHNIRILFACESGSRGWEFPSADSDYDLRFIFLRPAAAYLGITEPPDTIGLPLTPELDVYGWDLRKLLRLMLKSNVTPFEWLQSPVVYHSAPGFRDALWAICPAFGNPRRNAFHYLGIARGAMANLQGGTIAVKKLFYILRPLLAASWCTARLEIAPMRFPVLSELLPTALRAEVDELVARKARMNEDEPVGLSAQLLNYIKTESDRVQASAASLAHRGAEPATLNEFFVKCLSSYDDRDT